MRQTRFELGGQQYVVVCVDEPDVPASGLDKLTATEREIVAALTEGLSNQAIAVQRGRSVRTVDNQIAAIFRKLEVSSRVELIAVLSGRA